MKRTHPRLRPRRQLFSHTCVKVSKRQNVISGTLDGLDNDWTGMRLGMGASAEPRVPRGAFFERKREDCFEKKLSELDRFGLGLLF